MHGRVVIGLLGFVIEERHGSDDFVPARLTVDMFRLPNITTPVEVTTKVVRDLGRHNVLLDPGSLLVAGFHRGASA